MEKLFNHQIEVRDAQFQRKYIAECAQCKLVLFWLSDVNKMLKWNGQSLLQLRGDIIPIAITIGKTKLAPTSGTYTHNVYKTLSCECRAIIGLHILGACWTTQILDKQFLIEANKLRVMLVEVKSPIEVDLLPEFHGEGFIEYKPPSSSGPAVKSREEVKQDEEFSLKRRSCKKRKDESSKEEIQQVALYFGRMLTDLDHRISELDNGVKACLNVIHRVLPKQALNDKLRL